MTCHHEGAAIYPATLQFTKSSRIQTTESPEMPVPACGSNGVPWSACRSRKRSPHALLVPAAICMHGSTPPDRTLGANAVPDAGSGRASRYSARAPGSRSERRTLCADQPGAASRPVRRGRESWVRDSRDEGVWTMSLWLGNETNLSARIALIAETAGAVYRGGSYQAGARFRAVPGRRQNDAATGAKVRNIGASWWRSIGMRLATGWLLR